MGFHKNNPSVLSARFAIVMPNGKLMGTESQINIYELDEYRSSNESRLNRSDGWPGDAYDDSVVCFSLFERDVRETIEHISILLLMAARESNTRRIAYRPNSLSPRYPTVYANHWVPNAFTSLVTIKSTRIIRTEHFTNAQSNSKRKKRTCIRRVRCRLAVVITPAFRCFDAGKFIWKTHLTVVYEQTDNVVHISSWVLNVLSLHNETSEII